MLSDTEKERVRYHMGYLGVQGAASIQFGIPRPIQTVFLLESAMNNLISASEGRVREILGRLDVTEERIFAAQERLQVKRVEGVEMREDEPGQLENEYVRWAKRLADVLGCMLYPYSSRFREANAVSAGSIPVRH